MLSISCLTCLIGPSSSHFPSLLFFQISTPYVVEVSCPTPAHRSPLVQTLPISNTSLKMGGEFSEMFSSEGNMTVVDTSIPPLRRVRRRICFLFDVKELFFTGVKNSLLVQHYMQTYHDVGKQTRVSVTKLRHIWEINSTIANTPCKTLKTRF